MWLHVHSTCTCASKCPKECIYIVGSLEHFFPFSWECHHPNWRSHISEGSTTNQKPHSPGMSECLRWQAVLQGAPENLGISDSKWGDFSAELMAPEGKRVIIMLRVDSEHFSPCVCWKKPRRTEIFRILEDVFFARNRSCRIVRVEFGFSMLTFFLLTSWWPPRLQHRSAPVQPARWGQCQSLVRRKLWHCCSTVMAQNTGYKL